MRAAARIALVGCGRWGRCILRDLRALGATVEVVDSSSDARRRAIEGGALTALGDPGSLGAIDGIIVATPATTHASVIESLPAGVPMFIEKPIAIRASDARRIASRSGATYMMDKWRYHSAIEELARVAADGRLGAIRGVKTVRVQPEPVQFDVDAVWTLAPHDLSIFVEICGTLPIPRLAVAERDAGAASGLHAVLGDRPWLVMELSASRSFRERSVTVFGESGTAFYEDSTPQIMLQTQPGGVWDRLQVEEEMPLLRELEVFLGFLHGGPPPKSTAEDGVRIVETIEALRQMAGFG